MIRDRSPQPMIRHLVLAAALLALPGAALAQSPAKTAQDCEAIENAFEFNLCLASLAPVRGRVQADKPPPEDSARSGRSRQAGHRARATQSAQIYRPMGRSSPFLSLSGGVSSRW